jgi:hypothetical protein
MLRFCCRYCRAAYVVPVGSEGRGFRCQECREYIQVTTAEPGEAEDWPALADVYVLWECLRGSVSARKARLFACACLRRLDHLLEDDYREGLWAYERFADGLLPAQELQASTEGVRTVADRLRRSPRMWEACRGVAEVLRVTTAPDPAQLLWAAGLDDLAVGWAFSAGLETAHQVARWAYDAEHRAQCNLLRDIFGHLFTPVETQPEWFAYGGGLARQVARGIYDERRFEDLPVLADALEEAGCQEPLLLEHCREVGEHARGCWVVDLALGRE